MDSEQNNLLTNERVLAIIGFIIVVLGSGFIGLLVYIFNTAMKKIETYRVETTKSRSEFNDMMNNKFKAINHYMKQTDSVQVRHEAGIEGLREHARDVKTKLAEHEIKIQNHGERLAKHDSEINHLKKS